MNLCKKSVSVLLAVLTILTVMLSGVVPGTLTTHAASWNGYNYRGGELYGYQTFLEAYGIDYDVYMKWMDDHDADSPNPDYYLGTPYVGEDHRNPHGDCDGAYGYYDVPGEEGMNCTGFVWHVLYKSAVMSGAEDYQIDRLGVMAGMPGSWFSYGVYRIYFDSLEEAYSSGVLEKGDLMWIYGTSDNHNAIFYGDNPYDFIYWDSAGERNRYCEVHAIGDCRGLWVAKVTQPNSIELQIDTPSGGNGNKFGAKYCVFDSLNKAEAVVNNPDNMNAWDQRVGTIVLDSDGHGCLRSQSAPSASELWSGGYPRTGHSYFYSAAQRVDCDSNYYAVQWTSSSGISQDDSIHVFRDSGKRTSSGYRIYRFIAPIKVDTPAFSDVRTTCDGILLKWNAVRGAYKYRLYYRDRNGSWTKMTETSSTSYLDTDVIPGYTFTYTIRCLDRYDNFISEYNPTGWRQTFNVLDTPRITKLESTPEGVQISWDPVAGNSVIYRVYYLNSRGSWTKFAQTTGTTCIDPAVSNGVTYTYTVRCVDNAGYFTSKYYTTGWKHTYYGLETPQMTGISDEPDGLRLKWTAIEGAPLYRIYYKAANGSWARLADTTSTEFFDNIVNAGNSYTYTVRCVNSKGYFVSDYNKTGWQATYHGVDTPQMTEIQSEPEGIRMTWTPVENASLYRLYCKKPGGSWTKVTDTDRTEFFDYAVVPNTDYIYTVRCINSGGRFASDFNTNGWQVSYEGVETPQFTKIESEPEGIRMTWEPIENAYLYRIYCKKPGGKWVKLTETDQTEFLDSVVALNSDYIYTIRCINSKGYFASGFNEDGWKVTYQGVDMPRFSEVRNEPEGIRLTWEPVEGAQIFRIYCQKADGSWLRIAETKGTGFFDRIVTLGQSYTYTIRCVNSKGYFSSDFNDEGWTCRYTGAATPQITSLENTDEGIRIRWDAVEGAVAYRVFYKGQKGWTRLTLTDGTEVTDRNVTPGYRYTYTVRCIGSDDNYISDFNHDGTTIEYKVPEAADEPQPPTEAE